MTAQQDLVQQDPVEQRARGKDEDKGRTAPRLLRASHATLFVIADAVATSQVGRAPLAWVAANIR